MAVTIWNQLYLLSCDLQTDIGLSVPILLFVHNPACVIGLSNQRTSVRKIVDSYFRVYTFDQNFKKVKQSNSQMEPTRDRKEQILAAAIRRFSHYGFNKTSMSEIAEDIKLSKANLYYYYPDKFSLIEAIADFLTEESSKRVEELITRTSGTLHLLLGIIDIKEEYFNNYRMLFLNLNEINITDPRVQSLAARTFNREITTIGRIFEKGINTGELVTFDIPSTSELYCSMMRGLAMFCHHNVPGSLVGDVDGWSAIIEKQKQATAIFIDGIRKK